MKVVGEQVSRVDYWSASSDVTWR